MNDYLVSIITPSYNSGQYIEYMIKSIIAQTYKNWELLITDDASTDNSVDLIKEYMKVDKRIKLFYLSKNSGAGAARNNSIKYASGRFIAFCDSDDLWLPFKLEKQIRFMVDNKYPFTYTSYNVVNNACEYRYTVKCKKRISYFTLLRGNEIGCLTSMYDIEYFGKKYMPTVRKRQDWCLWLLLVKEIKYAFGLQEILALYRSGNKTSISSSKINLIKYNFYVYSKIEKYNYLFSVFLFAFLFMPFYVLKKIHLFILESYFSLKSIV